MTSKASDLRSSVGGADPLQVLITIGLIGIGKVVAKPLHIFAIANLLSAGVPARRETSTWSASTGDGAERARADGGKG
jgi:hypothetical protein